MVSKLILLQLLTLFGAVFGTENNLFTVLESESTSGIIDCNNEDALGCQKIEIHFLAIDNSTIRIDAFNVTLGNRKQVDETDESISYFYENDAGDEITMTLTENGTALTADLTVSSQGRIFDIANCGEGCHVLIEEDPTMSEGESPDIDIEEEEMRMLMTPEMKERIERGKLDRQSLVYISVKVYVTPQFAQGTSNVRGFVLNALAQMNTGFVNSYIYARVYLHCIEVSSVNDGNYLATILSQFMSSKGSWFNLRGGADMAALLTLRSPRDGCGYARLRGYLRGDTFSVTAKGCVGQHTFSHELGHNFGAGHNRETGHSYPDWYARGYLIRRNGQASGYRTVMAYNYAGYATRINYWSSTLTYGGAWNMGGAANDNRRVINTYRYSMAGVGNEGFGRC